MSNANSITIPSDMRSPAELAAWMDKELKSLTADLSPEEQKKLRNDSIDTITRIAMDYGNAGTKAKAEEQFRDYYRQVRAAVDASNQLDEARDLVESDKSNPTIVGQMARVVGDMNSTKTFLLSTLLGGLGMERMASSLNKLQALEMVVSGLSGGNGIFRRIGDMLGQLDGRLTEMNIDTSPQGIMQQAGGMAEHLPIGSAMDAVKGVLPAGIAGIFGKFVSHPEAEEPDMPPALRKPPSNTP